MVKLIYLSLFLISFNILSYNTYTYIGDKKVNIKKSDNFLVINTNKNILKSDISKLFQDINIDIENIEYTKKDQYVLKLNYPYQNLDKLKNKIIKDNGFIKSFGKGYIAIDYNMDWPLIETDQIIVNFKNNITDQEIKDLISENGLKIIKKSKMDKNLYIFKTDKDTITLSNRLYESGLVKYSEPNFYRTVKKFYYPDDPHYSKQWHLKNGTGGAKAEDGWDIEKGDPNIIIAIVDDGIDLDHEDLDILNHRNFTEEDYELGGDHGTACAGVATAKGDNRKGVTGVCFNCRVVSAKIMRGDSEYVVNSASGDAIEWAATNSDIISNSWGYTSYFPIPAYLNTAINHATTLGRSGKGCVVVFAAGNDSREIFDDELPGHPKIISVSASSYLDTPSTYTNYGSVVDVSAPTSIGGSYSEDHDNIFTTDAYNPNDDSGSGGRGYNHAGIFYQKGEIIGYSDFEESGKYTKFFGGTSSATPLVSGLAGLILSRNKNLTYTEVKNIILSTTDKVGGNYDETGHDPYMGYGRVNIYRALQNTPELCVPTSDTEICNNNIDDDCDTFIDGADDDCLIGDSCEDSIVEISNSGEYVGDSSKSNYTNSFTAPTNCSSSTNSRDIVYKIVLDRKSECSFELIEGDFDSVIYLSDSCGEEPIYCNDDFEAGNTKSKIETLLEAGEYYLVIDGYGTSNYGSFKLLVSITPFIPNPCEDINCSDHGECQNQGGIAACICDDGYYAENLECIPVEIDPCEGVNCSNHGVCEDQNGSALCICDTGYHVEELNCVEDVVIDPCEGITCSDFGVCEDQNGVAACICDDGYEADGTNCVKKESGGGGGGCNFNDNTKIYPFLLILFPIFLTIFYKRREN